MTITTGTMTDEQRKSVALEFLKHADNGGYFLELFAEDTHFQFLKFGMVRLSARSSGSSCTSTGLRTGLRRRWRAARYPWAPTGKKARRR
ncbi:MAG: hypothetical protein ACRDNZ_23120 [Streptosporangiaceae bacterium]